MKTRNVTAVTGLAILGLLASSAVLARTRTEIDTSADRALDTFYSLSPQNRALADKAVGILVFGQVTKAGAGVGGEFGEGVLRLKGKDANYYSVTSASVGLTLGVGEHREVFLFMTQESLDHFTHSDGWSAGADAALALVSKGAAGQYDGATLDKPILGFIFSEKGLLGDLSFEGSKITKIKSVE